MIDQQTVEDYEKGISDGIVYQSLRSRSKSLEGDRPNRLDPALQFRRFREIRIGVESGLVQPCPGSS